MMIRFRLAEILYTRGFIHRTGPRAGQININAAAPKIGLSYAHLWHIINHGQGIELRTLNRLCNLLHVTPAELLEYTPDADSSAPEGATAHAHISLDW